MKLFSVFAVLLVCVCASASADEIAEYSIEELNEVVEELYDITDMANQGAFYTEPGLTYFGEVTLHPFQNSCPASFFDFASGDWGPVRSALAAARDLVQIDFTQSMKPSSFTASTRFHEFDEAIASAFIGLSDSECLILGHRIEGVFKIGLFRKGLDPVFFRPKAKDEVQCPEVEFENASLQDIGTALMAKTAFKPICFEKTKLTDSADFSRLPKGLEAQFHWWLTELEVAHPTRNTMDIVAASFQGELDLMLNHVPEDAFPLFLDAMGVRFELLAPNGWIVDEDIKFSERSVKFKALLSFLHAEGLRMFRPGRQATKGDCLPVSDADASRLEKAICYIEGLEDNKLFFSAEFPFDLEDSFYAETLAAAGIVYDKDSRNWSFE